MAESFGRTSRALVLAMLTVVLSFLVTSVYSQLRLNSSTEALSIAATSAPSIAELSTARAKLRQLGAQFDRLLYRERVSDGEPAEIRRLRVGLDRALEAYKVLPVYRGEEDLYRRVPGELRRLDEIMGRVLAALAAGSRAATETTIYVELHPAIEALDESLRTIMEHNRARLHDSARVVQESHRRLNRISLVLSAFSVVLAGLATWMVLLTLRRYMRVLEYREKELAHFAIQVSHDIANPLIPISAALHVAREHVAAAEAVRMIERGERGTARIRSDIETLLAFATADAAPRPDVCCRASTVLPIAIESAKALHTLDIVPAEMEDCELRCSAGVLSAVLRGLFENGAQRLRDGASRRLLVRLTRRPGFARIEVEDAGAAPAAAERAFAPRIRDQQTGYPGIELELARTRRLVQAHHGAVGVRRDGRGATFWVELPTC
jgi:hypothetical protein